MSRAQPRDLIAREAARLLQAGKAESIRDAIEQAARRIGRPGAALPGEGRVRQHLQAMRMQTLGESSYRREVRSVLAVAEELMTAMQELDGVEPLLVGRAARGQVDGPTGLHVRLYTALPVEALARRLEDLGYTELVHQTRNSPHGRLNRMVLVEEGIEVVITRCPPSLRASADRNLYTGEPVATADLRRVRQLMEASGGPA